jgi:hypothetical protein
VVDTAFFVALRRFVARADAPAEARAAVDFLHGIGVWDWRETAAAAKTLVEAPGPPWLPNALVRNGGVVANIMVKDTAEARRLMRIFAARTDDDAFRERILSSILTYLDPVLFERMRSQ